MGKAYNCIKMLEYLSTGKTYKVSELAACLETNPRNIIEYKNTLIEMGYDVESISGRYGGIKLNSRNILPPLKFTPSEKEALIEGFRYISSKRNFL